MKVSCVFTPSVGACANSAELLLGQRLQQYYVKTGIITLQNIKPVWICYETWKTTCHHSRKHRGLGTWAEGLGRRETGMCTQEDRGTVLSDKRHLASWRVLKGQLHSLHRYGSHRLRETSWTSFISWPYHSLPVLQNNLNLAYMIFLYLTFSLVESK